MVDGIGKENEPKVNEHSRIGEECNYLMCEFKVFLQLGISRPAVRFTAALQELIFISI